MTGEQIFELPSKGETIQWATLLKQIKDKRPFFETDPFRVWQLEKLLHSAKITSGLQLQIHQIAQDLANDLKDHIVSLGFETSSYDEDSANEELLEMLRRQIVLFINNVLDGGYRLEPIKTTDGTEESSKA